ncbi:MAG: DUF962 domain-containing protein [Herminiimonas sp.]|nr:DUF962 domain-containing protein [Herminiimonas sp.]
MNHALPHRHDVAALIDKYAESHLNPVNEIIHFICVPAIVLSILGLLWAVHPLLAIAGSGIALVYYFMLSVPLTVGMLAMLAAMLGLVSSVPAHMLVGLSIGIFVVAWIGQFIGHKIEGKKPSFFDDVRFLLIGPLFVIGFLYRKFKIAY